MYLKGFYMIKKKIKRYNKLFFITLLYMFLYDSINCIVNNLFDEIGITDTINYLKGNPELAKLFINDLLITLIEKKNPCKNILLACPTQNNKRLRLQTLEKQIKENSEEIKPLYENIDKVITAYIEDIKIIEDERKPLSSIILDNMKELLYNKNTNTNEETHLDILKRKEKEYQIQQIIPQIKSSEKNTVPKYIRVIQYMDKYINIDEQNNFINQIDNNKKIKIGFDNFDIEPLKKEIGNTIEEKVKKSIETHQPEITSQIKNILSKEMTNKIEACEKQISALEAKLNNTKIELSDEQLNAITKKIQDEYKKNIDSGLDKNKINTFITRIEKLEKANERLLYITIALTIACSAALYKSFYSSDEN